MQKYAAGKPAIIPWSQNDSRTPSEVVGVGVQIVAVPGLARAAVAAAVMGDAAVAAGSQKEHLVFPGVRAQRPAMTEDHGLSAAPVLVVQLDVLGISFTDSNVWHIDHPFCVCVNLDVGRK